MTFGAIARTSRNVLSRLQPWHPPSASADALGLLLLTVIAWDLLLTLDAHLTAATSGFLHVVTFAAYPLLVALCIVCVADPPLTFVSRLPFRRVLSVAPLVVLIGLACLVVQVPSAVSSSNRIQDDVTPSILCAAQDVMRGKDPYLTPELSCLNRLHVTPVVGTPLMRGPLAHQRTYPTHRRILQVAAASEHKSFKSPAFPVFGYPPMSFIWMLPVALLGHGAWVAWTLLGGAIWLAAVARGSRALWPAAVLLMILQFGAGSVLAAATQGDGEFFGFACASLAILFMDRARTSSVLMALAVLTNPLLLLVAAGYGAMARHFGGASRRLAVFLATCLLIGLPWIVVERNALASMVGLVTQPTFAFGLGLVQAFGSSPDPTWVKPLLDSLVVAAMLAVLTLSWRSARWSALAVVLAPALMWLSWKSDANYLAQVFPLAVAATVAVYRLRDSTTSPANEPAPARPGAGLEGLAAT